MKLNAYLLTLLDAAGIDTQPPGWNGGASSIWPELNRMLTTGW
jgi:hypothetical protein